MVTQSSSTSRTWAGGEEQTLSAAVPGTQVDPSTTAASWEEGLNSKGCSFTAAGMGTSEQC